MRSTNIVQAAWAGAILIIGLANFQPVRADSAHREPTSDPTSVATATPAAATEPLRSTTPAAATPAATDAPSQLQPTAIATEPAPSSSPTPGMAETPSQVQPTAIATGLVPPPSPSPKPLTERINPALLRYHGLTTVPEPAQPLGSESADHAADLAGGTWYCRTFAGSVMTHAFFSKAGAASSLEVETQVPVAADRVVTLHESYAHDAETGAWRVSLANGLIDASAPAWNGETWTFEGHQRDGTKAVGFRMIFNRFGPDVFVRDFQHREGNVWQTFSGETCRRNVAP